MRSAEAGFTLIEVMVALAVLSVAAVAMVSASEAYIRRVHDLELRAAAQWLGEARLAEAELGLGDRPTEEVTYGFRLGTETVRSATADPGLERITVEVSALDVTDAPVIARITGFAVAPDATGTGWAP